MINAARAYIRAAGIILSNRTGLLELVINIAIGNGQLGEGRYEQMVKRLAKSRS